MNDGSGSPDRREDSDVARVGISKPFWNSMLISFFVFWALDLVTSATLISQGFGSLEYNVFVRLFVEAPSWHHFFLFARDQELYLIPLLLAVSAPALEWVAKGQDGNQLLYTPTAIVVFLYAAERLDLGVASNTANLLAVLFRQPLPASGTLFYILCGALDGLWVFWAWRYVRRGRAVVVPPLPYS